MDGTLVRLKVKCTDFSRRQERLPSRLGPVRKSCFGAKAVASSSVRYRDAQVLHRVCALFVDGRVVGVLGGAQAIVVQPIQFPGLVIIGYCIDGCPVPPTTLAANLRPELPGTDAAGPSGGTHGATRRTTGLKRPMGGKAPAFRVRYRSVPPGIALHHATESSHAQRTATAVRNL